MWEWASVVDNLHVLTIILVTVTPKQRFELVYAPEVKQHLKAIERKHYALIRRQIEAPRQKYEKITVLWIWNLKPLKRPVAFEAEWEIRFGPNDRFRVFCEADREQGKVYILATGVKERKRLFIGGEEVEL